MKNYCQLTAILPLIFSSFFLYAQEQQLAPSVEYTIGDSERIQHLTPLNWVIAEGEIRLSIEDVRTGNFRDAKQIRNS